MSDGRQSELLKLGELVPVRSMRRTPIGGLIWIIAGKWGLHRTKTCARGHPGTQVPQVSVCPKMSLSPTY